MNIKNTIVVIIVSIFLLMGCSGCTSLPRKNINIEKTIAVQVDEAIKNKIESGELSVQEILITQKIVYFVAPLVLALFTSIILIFLGVRLVGLGILVSSVTCLFVILGLSLYMKYVAIVGVVVLLVAVYLLGREIFTYLVERFITIRWLKKTYLVLLK
jgi:hypothetical protein